MVQPGDVIEVPDLNLRFEIRATAASTGGEYAEFDAVGRPRGFIKLLRPALRWNHNWAIARAMEGLEPFVQRRRVAV